MRNAGGSPQQTYVTQRSGHRFAHVKNAVSLDLETIAGENPADFTIQFFSQGVAGIQVGDENPFPHQGLQGTLDILLGRLEQELLK